MLISVELIELRPVYEVLIWKVQIYKEAIVEKTIFARNLGVSENPQQELVKRRDDLRTIKSVKTYS